MAKNSKITLPNGVTIELSADFTPVQINAIITSVMAGESFTSKLVSNKVENEPRSLTDIWNSSKKEKLCLFIRNYFSETLWFSAREVLEEQLLIVRSILFGETSQISTYLKRLHEEGLFDRQNFGYKVKYRSRPKLFAEYPEVTQFHFRDLVSQSLQE